MLGASIDGQVSLLRVSKNGNLIAASKYPGNIEASICQNLEQFSDQGLLIGGVVYGGVGGGWEDLSLTASSPAGSWAPLSVSITGLSGAILPAAGTLTHILDGVQDSGGGVGDALVCLTAVP